jgi:hypothetical protein
MTRRLKAAILTSVCSPGCGQSLWPSMPETSHRAINIVALIFVRLAKINIL